MPQPDRAAPSLTTEQVAARMGVSAQLVRQWATDGLLRVFRLPSGHRRFYAEDVDRFIATRTSDEVAS